MSVVLYVYFPIEVTLDHAGICEILCVWNRYYRIITANGRCVVLCS